MGQSSASANCLTVSLNIWWVSGRLVYVASPCEDFHLFWVFCDPKDDTEALGACRTRICLNKWDILGWVSFPLPWCPVLVSGCRPSLPSSADGNRCQSADALSKIHSLTTVAAAQFAFEIAFSCAQSSIKILQNFWWLKWNAKVEEEMPSWGWAKLEEELSTCRRLLNPCSVQCWVGTSFILSKHLFWVMHRFYLIPRYMGLKLHVLRWIYYPELHEKELEHLCQKLNTILNSVYFPKMTIYNELYKTEIQSWLFFGAFEDWTVG